jgi:threonine dehydrogenase-like Zn-dependent dehydrogenase
MASAKLLAGTSATASLKWGPLSIKDVDPPGLPNSQWVRVRPLLSGICGSDLATVFASTTRYFEPLVSFPFTPGHEIVGLSLDTGTRVVVESALTCKARDLPLCRFCRDGKDELCESVAAGNIKEGIQIGYCRSTGGGWSQELVAHRSQLWPVDDSLSDEDAVLVEPLACALHSVHSAVLNGTENVAVVGAGTVGLLTLASLAYLFPKLSISVVAKYSNQRVAASRLGATQIVAEDELERSARRLSHSFRKGGWLSGGYDVVFDCVGSSKSLSSSISSVRPGGQVVAVGMPSQTDIDLTPLWHREVSLKGSYAYGVEVLPKERFTHLDLTECLSATEDRDGQVSIRTFDLALYAMKTLRLGWMVSHRYPLENYVDALEKAARAGSHDAIKVAFDLRKSKSVWKGKDDL